MQADVIYEDQIRKSLPLPGGAPQVTQEPQRPDPKALDAKPLPAMGRSHRSSCPTQRL